jgi:hypothetical protein
MWMLHRKLRLQVKILKTQLFSMSSVKPNYFDDGLAMCVFVYTFNHIYMYAHCANSILQIVDALAYGESTDGESGNHGRDEGGKSAPYSNYYVTLTTALTFEDFPQSDPVEEFFRTKFAPMINTPKYRILIGIVLVIWLIPAIVFVFKLEPTTQQEQFLSDDHPLQAQIL